jgi:tetratricopeptide (TPR) repeat protein
MVGLFVIMIGYSSYALIIIRSAANTPMDQNSPEDIFTLGSYLSREQYGETPLLYGQTYVSEVEYKVNGNMVEAVTVDEGPVWTRIAKKDSSEKDRYFVSRRKERYIMRDELNTLFPRMHSKSDSKHIEAYKAWADVKGKRVRLTDYDGNAKIVIKPTFVENIRFFLNYQVNFMYIRYFMWNFSGRQNDIQGHGEVSNGNWITGIKFIDNHLAGPQDDMPDSIAKNKGHNVYYMLPLLLGLLGIAFQVSSGKRGIEGFWVVFLLFFMTGLAIVVYLNQPPYQPRERDYAYAGSFYAFCIWIGLGVAYIVRTLEKYVKKVPVVATSAAGSLLCLLIPLQMASQNWDDHNRSKRYLTRDFGFNYLTTCEPNAVIFTMGDNDTFPLWYAQEVEGYRTDVRVCNLSYLQTDWYVDQMKRQSYESTPLPISWNRADYIQGKHDAARIIRQTDNAWDVSRALDRIKSDDVKTKKIQGYSGQMDNVPTYLLYIPVNKSAAIASGVVKPENADWLLDSMYLYFGPQYNEKNEVVQPAKTYLAKEEMMILNMLSNNKDWSRPFYYAITVSADEYVGLDPYFRQDGIAYRIVPYNTIREEGRRYDTDILYDNLMHKYRWGNLEQPGLYIDENSGRLARTFRSLFGALGANLVNEGKLDKAKEAMDYALKVIPAYNIPHDYISSRDIADTYLLAGDTVKAKEIYDTLVETSLRELKWYSRLKTSHYASAMNEVWKSIICLQRIIHFYENIDPEKYKALIEDYQLYVSQFYQFQERNTAPEGGKNR